MQVRKLRQLFDEIDETGDGTVDRGELRRYVAALQRRRPDLPLSSEVDSVFSSLDKDRSGLLSFAEVCPRRPPLAGSVPRRPCTRANCRSACACAAVICSCICASEAARRSGAGRWNRSRIAR